MPYEVHLTSGAGRDLEDIFDYISATESARRASDVLDRLLRAARELETLPLRGAYPRELAELGIREYRQVFFKPYRIIYRVVAQRVYIYVIADGRRNMQSLLSRRLLGARV